MSPRHDLDAHNHEGHEEKHEEHEVAEVVLGDLRVPIVTVVVVIRE